MIYSIDFETRSKISLPDRGLGIYANDDTTEVLCIAFGTQPDNVSVNKPIKYNQLQLNHISFAQPKTSKTGTKSIAIKYNDKLFWNLILPKMSITFDVKQSDKGMYQMSLTFDSQSPEFQQLCCDLDQMMIQQGCDNSVEWLGASKTKPYIREVVESKYKPVVKYSKDKETGELTQKYPPRFQVTLPTSKDGKLTCEIYNQFSELVEVNPDSISQVLSHGVQCVALVTANVWSNSANGYGITWRAVQIKISPPKPRVCLLADDE
jgi:hypothetical protein